MRTFMWPRLSFQCVLRSPKAALFGSLVVLPLGLACGSDSFKPVPPADPNELYWDLALNHHAVLLATAPSYDTLTLVAIPRNVHGEPLAGLPPAQYTSSDIEKVTVTPDGVLHALAPTPPGTVVTVTATLTAGNLKYTDQVMVSVVGGDAPPILASLSVHPLPADSAKIAATNSDYFGFFEDTLPVRAADAGGTPIPTIPGDIGGVLPVDIRAADTALFNKSSLDFYRRNILRGTHAGTTKIYASTTALGITRADTLEYRIGWPVAALINMSPLDNTFLVGVGGADGLPRSNIFTQPDVTIGVGGVVVWTNNVDSTSQIDIHFSGANVSNVAPFEPTPSFVPTSAVFWFPWVCAGALGVPADCTNGGDALFSPDGYRWALRVFPVPGTYEYSSAKYPGSGGRIVVVDER